MIEYGANVKSIDFFRMNFSYSRKKTSTCYGAVLYNKDPLTSDNTLFIGSIIVPHPNMECLYIKISETHQVLKNPVLVLEGYSRNKFISLLEGFCCEGTPLPDFLNTPGSQIQGITEFQKSVYEATCNIPHGETRPYTWLSTKVKKSGAERAVGRAMGSNPFPLLIPCHRVVKKDGSIGGFMGNDSSESWQVQLKRSLLDLEESHRQPSLFSLNTGHNASL